MSEHVPWLAGDIITASALQNMGGPITSYIPTLGATTTAPTMGTNAVTVGSYSRHSAMVHGRALIAFGTAGVAAGSGEYTIPLPVPFLDQGTSEFECGSGHIYDSNLADNRLVGIYIVASDLNNCRMLAEGSGTVGATSPWTWAINDIIDIHFSYPGNF